MNAFTTPGVYFRHEDNSSPAIGPLRTDIAAFVGYAERGPLFEPVKIQSLRQFNSVFGNRLSFGYLAYAVQGFFENGGRTCYISRVADPNSTTTAHVNFPGLQNQPEVHLFASHGVVADPVTGAPSLQGTSPEYHESPGAWGNRLSITVQNAGLGTTSIPFIENDSRESTVESLTGIEVGSLVRITQAALVLYRRVVSIDKRISLILWDTPLQGFNVGDPVLVETMEFTLNVLLDGQLVERHTDVSLSPLHSRYIVDLLQSQSVYVDAAFPCLENEECDLLHPAEWQDSEQWPIISRLSLTGGTDGLNTVAPDHFLEALRRLELVDEINLLAIPDLVSEPTLPASSIQTNRITDPCIKLGPPDQGILFGEVLEEGSSSVLSQVTVYHLGGSQTAVTDLDGTFTLEGLPEGRVNLLLTKEGFFESNTTGEARLLTPKEPAPFFLAPITVPPAFSTQQILDVQQAMIAQGERGLYRVALLDPPKSMLTIDAIQSWRSQFDSGYAALYFPWIRVEQGENNALVDIPPSGHVAGIIAQTDLNQGVHKAPANEVFSGVKALTLDVNDREHGILNPQGINALRLLPGRGIRVYGARTLSSDPEWRFLNIRRLLLMIEETIEDANQWAVFEPNNEFLRQMITFNLNKFLEGLWEDGALVGDTLEAAFQVRCNRTNNPQHVVDAGQLVADIAVAPTTPFEFIHLRLGRTVDAIQIRE